MTIQLAPGDQALVADIAERGPYADDTEVIHEALRALDNQLRLRRLREMADEAEAQIARGDYVEWTPDLMNQIRLRAREMVRLGLPIDPDVCP
jgi:Arc/MetJ-type ribon-helix-helix transcriptional regulator